MSDTRKLSERLEDKHVPEWELNAVKTLEKERDTWKSVSFAASKQRDIDVKALEAQLAQVTAERDEARRQWAIWQTMGAFNVPGDAVQAVQNARREALREALAAARGATLWTEASLAIAAIQALIDAEGGDT